MKVVVSKITDQNVVSSPSKNVNRSNDKASYLKLSNWNLNYS